MSLLRFLVAKKVYPITKLLSYPQMSTSSSSTAPSAAVLAMKLVWNSPPDPEMVYDTVFAELMTRFVYEGVDYVAYEADSDAMVMPAPAGPNATRQANHEKSVIKVNEQARKAMGILMGLFHPDCNAHRSLTTWYAEVLPGLTPLQLEEEISTSEMHSRNGKESISLINNTILTLF